MRQVYGDFVIRDWEPSDRQPAAQLIAEVLQEFGLCCEPKGADLDVLEVEHHYLEKGGVFWVIEKANPQQEQIKPQLLGTAGFMPIPRGQKAVEIRKMYLRPEARGQGLGRHLLQTLETEIWQRGFEQIWLETATVLKGAVHLYEKFGYDFQLRAKTFRAEQPKPTLTANRLLQIQRFQPSTFEFLEQGNG